MEGAVDRKPENPMEMTIGESQKKLYSIAYSSYTIIYYCRGMWAEGKQYVPTDPDGETDSDRRTSSDRTDS